MTDTDIIHPFSTDKEWNESFYFNFYDTENDICGFMRIGLKPNQKEKNMFCFFLMPDGSLVGMKENATLLDDSLSANGLRFEKKRSEKLWHLSFDGPMGRMSGKEKEVVMVNFSLYFEALNDIFDYRECVDRKGEEISKQVASEHLEQFGKATGKLRVGSNEFMISGLGERDHSWGVRDWNAPKMWIWITAEFNESTALNVTKLITDLGTVDAGFIHLQGRNIPLLKAEIETVLNEDGGPKYLKMHLHDSLGNVHQVSAAIMREAKLPFPSRDGKSMSVLHEPIARYDFNGMIGYGIAEFLIRRE